MTSCFMDGVKGDGNVVSKKRKISDDFAKVTVSRGLDVHLTKSSNVGLVVEADANLHDLIETTVENGVLRITSKRNIWSASSKKILLSVDHLNAIHVNSGAEVIGENTFSTDELTIDVSSGAFARMDLEVGDLTCNSSSGADIKISGEAEQLHLSSSSGSDINAYKLEAKNCKANASSGSDIRLHATETFEGEATSGADISFKGSPQVIKQVDNSGGSVRNVGA